MSIDGHSVQLRVFIRAFTLLDQILILETHLLPSPPELAGPSSSSVAGARRVFMADVEASPKMVSFTGVHDERSMSDRLAADDNVDDLIDDAAVELSDVLARLELENRCSRRCCCQSFWLSREEGVTRNPN